MSLGVANILLTNPLLSDRIRLSLMAILASSEVEVSFNELLLALNLTKGNLSTHLRKLEEGGLIQVNKNFVDRKPRTTYACTLNGRKALKEYLQQVEAMLRLSK